MVRSLPVALQKDEEVLAVVRRSALTMVFKILFTFIWFCLPFLFFFPLLRLGGVGVAVFALLLCGVLLYAWRLWKTFRQTMLIVTDRRVIDVDQSSWRTSQIVDIPVAEVKTVMTERESFIGGLFDLGKIRIETGDNAAFDVEWSGVRHPQMVADLLREVQSLYRR